MLKEIGKELKLLRIKQDLTIKQAEEKSGIRQQLISNYELGKSNITIYQLEKLLNSYNENVFIFFNRLYEYSHNKNE